METTQLRSKEEIKQEIEASRRETKRTLREAKKAWVTENPAVVAWKKTKLRAQDTRLAVTDKAYATDCALRSNIYKVLGVAAVAGVVAGYFSRRRKKTEIVVEVERCC